MSGRRIVGALALAFVLGNLLVARHAYRFLHFDPAPVDRSPSPQALGWVDRIGILVGGVSLPRPRLHRDPSAVGLPFVSTIDQGIAAWTIPGTGAGTALLLHGYGGAKDSLLDEARVLYDRGFTVVLIDFPGAGDSAGDETTLGWTEGAVVARLLEAGDLPPPVVLFGDSMGAAAALRAVGPLGAPAAGLVLENPYDRLSTTVGHRMNAMGLPAQPGASLLLAWGSLLAGFNGFAQNPVEHAAAVRIPTLLLCGDEDPWVRPDEIRAIDAALAGPHQLVFFPGVGHRGLFAADPAAWAAAVWPFLAEHDLGGRPGLGESAGG